MPSPRTAKKSSVSPLSQVEAGSDTPGTPPPKKICRHGDQGSSPVASPGSSSPADPGKTLLLIFVYGQRHLRKGVLSTMTPLTLASGLNHDLYCH